jgi:short-subunit dehydrogenase
MTTQTVDTPLLDIGSYGPWAVVAGASEGTGAAFAREIARSGIKLLLVARRQVPLDTLAEELRRDHGVEVRTLSLDLNAEDAGQRILAAATDIEVGLYVANAGAGQGGTPFLDMPMQTIRDLIARNIFVTIEACQHFGRGMRERGRGGIVLMGSGAGLGGQPGVAAYSGVKGFVLNLAESLWSELRDAGVDVIGIAAPVMETPALRAALGDRDFPGILPAEDVVRNTLRRLPAQGPCYVYSLEGTEAESERQTGARRDRVLAVEQFSKAFFKKD